MKFQVWKVTRANGRLVNFSFRQHRTNPPVVLNQYQFEDLFPGFDPDLIPEAPKTITISLRLEIEN